MSNRFPGYLPCYPRLLLALMGLLVVLTGCSSSAPERVVVTNPLRLHNPQAPFQIRLSSDHNPVFIGSLLSLKLSADAPVIFNLFAIHTSGATSQLLVNRKVTANQVLLVPEPTDAVDLRLSPPAGMETFILTATRSPLDWPPPALILQTIQGVRLLRLDSPTLVQGLADQLLTLPGDSWATTTLELPLEPLSLTARQP